MRKLILSIALLAAIPVMAGEPQTKVYTTESGKKYHTHKDCQYIKNSSSIKETTIQQAQKDGKSLCSRCNSKDKKGDKK